MLTLLQTARFSRRWNYLRAGPLHALHCKEEEKTLGEARSALVVIGDGPAVGLPLHAICFIELRAPHCTK